MGLESAPSSGQLAVSVSSRLMAEVQAVILGGFWRLGLPELPLIAHCQQKQAAPTAPMLAPMGCLFIKSHLGVLVEPLSAKHLSILAIAT